jgi:hypothetical protein
MAGIEKLQLKIIGEVKDGLVSKKAKKLSRLNKLVPSETNNS